MSSISAWPLQWPEGWKRTPAGERRPAKFSRGERKHTTFHNYSTGREDVRSYTVQRDLTVADARRRVLAELERMGLVRDDVVLSTNLPLRLDGEPRSDAKNPSDPGAAVYWQESTGERRVMAIDQYDRVADNLAAIAATLDAMRAIERHGGAVILERAFTGFTALPAPGATATAAWWIVLELNTRHPTKDELLAAYRRLRSLHHPDRGGSAERFDEVERAYREATS